jgi:acyl transferase domain-containing protein
MSKATTDGHDDAGIAIIGMAGRFPGASTIAAFWENISTGKESISSLSDEELRHRRPRRSSICGRVLPRCHWKKSMRRFAGLKLEQVS